MLPYAAYLRVYEPLTAFSPPERVSWETYAGARDRPRRATALHAEHGEAVARLLGVPPIPAPPHESPNAYLRRVEDMLYVCPWQSRLRSWLAFSRFRGATPARLVERFVPISIAEQTADDFDRFKRRGGSAALRTHIRTSTWHIPVSWFVPFDGNERWLVLNGGPAAESTAAEDSAAGDAVTGGSTAKTSATSAGGRNLLYVTTMAHARRRTARALQIIRRHGGDAGVTVEVEDVARWLEEFHPHSLVELDYGGIVHLMDDRRLQADQSVSELAAALTGLETGQEELAFAMYQRVILRWRSIQLLESAN
ncbi:hypothetical protein GCM10010156_63550 [Planobispora rosea]|uniref:DUF8083 domain-containing protein n=1 Tax=Planobispora rosea TaxID=35762 RepID=A0A8J3S9Q8_PLARO|nr:hypothetical protein [Planobispora rosea]GGS96637.1 hypothetical protein GCM10010156_63550 [Planobispora rosea]GIH87654.1 hypothetical protein Pro02_60620 [Planobispora rosea]